MKKAPKTKTIQETADIFGVHYRTIQRWLKSGYLNYYKVGRVYHIKETEIERIQHGK